MWRYEPDSCTATTAAVKADRHEGVVTDHLQMPADINSALDTLVQHMHKGDGQVSHCFSSTRPLIAARAPGRLDVMGGIADYSGSTVLQLPLQESTVVLCQQYDQAEFRITSQSTDDHGALRAFSMPMSDFFAADTGIACSERRMHQYFSELGDEHQWVAYVAGVLTVLMHELQCDFTDGRGIVLLVSSTVPQGKGVSSSAALEVAAMRAVCALFELNISAHRQAVLCQRVENHIVGAPCGLMDQMASSCAQEGSLLHMLCQPDKVYKPVTLPDGLSLWGIDSGIRHAVSGADYVSVRCAAFMGYRYILEAAGVAGNEVAAADIQDVSWKGYLANVSVSEYLQRFEATLPDWIRGRDFLQHFDDTTDTITTVDPERAYAVRACTAHPVMEHFRARLFIQLATNAQEVSEPDPRAQLMGECMYQSHASYSACGLNSEGTDDLVARLRKLGHSSGIYGARITGGGSGGVVAVLAKPEADSVIRAIASDYSVESGVGGYVFSGSSAGAEVIRLEPSSAA